MADDLTNLGIQLGDLLSGGVARRADERGTLAGAKLQELALRSGLVSSQTEKAIAEAEIARQEQAARANIRRLAPGERPSLADTLLGRGGSDLASYEQAELRRQEYENRAKAGDPTVPLGNAQRAALAFSNGPVNPFEEVGGGYANILEPEKGVLPLGAAVIKPDTRAPVLVAGTGGVPTYSEVRDAIGKPAYVKDTDTSGPTARRNSQSLRKEFRSLPSIKEYEAALPIIESAKKAPDTASGDILLAYTLGKVLDPTSVVREGELALTFKAGSLLEQLLGTTSVNFGAGGRLRPQVRQQLIAALDERVSAYKQFYDRDYQQYSQYAAEQGFSPETIVGKRADEAFRRPDSAPASNAAGTARLPTFATEAEAQAAGIKPGTRVVIGGVTGTWQ